MFDQLFTRQATVVRYQSLPFAAERQLYLKHLVEEGRSRKTVRNIAQLLVVVVRHVSIDTTNIYAEVDLQRKAEVLAYSNNFSTTPTPHNKPWKDDPSLLAFLRSL